jgi:autotransporter-associated beta strand protein
LDIAHPRATCRPEWHRDVRCRKHHPGYHHQRGHSARRHDAEPGRRSLYVHESRDSHVRGLRYRCRKRASAKIVNDFALNFNGTSSAGAATITNNGFLTFNAKSSAGQAIITTAAVLGTLEFHDQASAGTASITNHSPLVFFDSSTADQAFITSDQIIAFEKESSGGTARIKLDGGSLDISLLTTGGTTIGSIEGSGNVFLSNKNLAVGGNNQDSTFSGAIQDGTPSGGGNTGGSLTKEGTGTLTLTGINTYTGATTIKGGALIVDGSISSAVTVNAGGTLAGAGTVASTTINAGGTLAPGRSASVGTETILRVKGDLTFSSGATYLVQFSPSFSTSAAVTTLAGGAAGGTATLGGATVVANFTPGTYVTNKYIILQASRALNGTFGNLVNTNLAPFFTTSLSYDANNVFLNLSAVDAVSGGGSGPNATAGLNTNQRNVFHGIVNSFNLMGGAPAVFLTQDTLTPAGLTQISGETAVGTQQATFDAMNQFMGVMLDPTVGALSGGRAFAQANDANAAMARKAPLSAEAFDARWGVWAAGFGGSQSISGDAVLGSNKTTSNVFGSVAGAEYRFSPNTVAGFALAGGGTNFRVANGGSGNSDLFQAGAYVKHTQGAAFIAAALAYGWQDVTTNRNVTVAGIDNLRGRFNSNAISGRLEGGYKVATQAGEFTPYAAGQFTTYRLPSYAEQVASGANTFALAYNGKDVTATRSELGLRSEKAVALTDATLMLRSRLAWAHDFNTDRNVQAAFLTLPGSAFVVNGAQPAADTALTTVSAEMLWRNGWSAAVTADAQLSDTTHSYSGKGVVRYNW